MPTLTTEQLHTQSTLQALDLLADGTWSDVQLRSSSPHMAKTSD